MEKKISCIIIDDDELDRHITESHLLLHDCMQLVGSFASVMDALPILSNRNIQVLFMDVDMPGISGIEFLRTMKDVSPVCVMITSYPEFALESFELKVFDYILKPLTAPRLLSTVERLREFIELKENALAYTVLCEKETILFKEGYNIIRLPIHEINYLEALGDYTKVITLKKNYLTLTILSKFLELLPQEKFIRIHRSYAVSRYKVKGVSATEIALEGHQLPIGKTYQREIRQSFSK